MSFKIPKTRRCPDGNTVELLWDERRAQEFSRHNKYQARRSWYWKCSCGAESSYQTMLVMADSSYRHAHQTKKHAKEKT
jgi:hypothetical protein